MASLGGALLTLLIHTLLVTSLDPLLSELERVLREGGRIAQDARNNLQRELKPDGSVVTNGDRDTETYFRQELPKFVDAPIWGEEFGFATEGEKGLWTVDPVDGTTNYSFGSPIWGVTAALMLGDHVEFGGVFLPDMDELFLAKRGEGAFCNGHRLAPIPPGPIQKHETVSYNDTLMRRYPNQKWPGKMRCSGAFVVEGAFVAQQRFRGMIGLREKLYDVAACLCIGRELDADVRLASGEPLLMDELKQNKPIGEPWLIFPRESGFFLDVEDEK